MANIRMTIGDFLRKFPTPNSFILEKVLPRVYNAPIVQQVKKNLQKYPTPQSYIQAKNTQPSPQEYAQKNFPNNPVSSYGNKYITNRYVEPIRAIPHNFSQTFNPSSSWSQRGQAAAGLVGGVASLVPDPIQDIAFPLADYAKGVRASGLRGGKGMENIKAGLRSMSLEQPVGLGTALTTNPTGEMVGNIAELPLALLGAHKLNPKSAQPFDKRTIELVRRGFSPEVRDMVGQFSSIVEQYPTASRKNLGQLGDYIQTLATSVFGKQVENLTNKQIKNALDLVMQQAFKEGSFPKQYPIGLQAQNVRGKKSTLSYLRSGTHGGFTNIREVDNPLVKGKEYVDEMAARRSNFLEEIEVRRQRIPDSIAQPLESIINSTFNDVRKKANILDYLRTPSRVYKKFGMEEEANLLRKKYDDYQMELPKEIDKITAWSKRVTPDANVRIFRFLDGKYPRLDNPIEEKVALEIKDYLKEWAHKLKLPEDRQITNYITHLFPKGSIEKEFDPDIAKLINSKVVKSVFNPFLQKRIDVPEYLENVWPALDAYAKRGVRKFHMDPALERVAAKAEHLPLESFNYIKSHIARINMQPTEIDNLIDNAVKTSPIGYKLGQRPVTAVTQKARQMVFRGLLGLNPASALRNLQQSTNTYSLIGEKNFGIGLMKTVMNLPKLLLNKNTELEMAGVLGKDIVQDRTINAVGKFWEKTDDTLFYLFNMAEKVNRGIAYWGAKNKGIAQGMDEARAISYAKGIVGKTQFYYDVIDTPAALQSDIAKTLAQFMKYPLAQSEFLVEMVKDKNVAGSIRWIVSNLLFIASAGKILGLDYKDMFPQMRFGVPPTMQLPWEVGKAAMNAPDKYGGVSDESNPVRRILGSNGVLKGAMNYIPAGGQIRKTWEGLNAYREGASLTPTGRERFPIEQNRSNLLKTAFLGQYATPGGQEYIQNLGKSKSEVLYETLKKLPPEQAANTVSQLKQSNPTLYRNFNQFMKDKSMNVTTDEEQVRNLPVRDGSRAKRIVKQFNSLGDPAKKAALWKRYKQAGIITADIEKQLNAARQAGALK